MLVGFIHGVMNTDNMTISGETIDYGPCAFMDAYDPDTVFSSIDAGAATPTATSRRSPQWNLARFAETLLPLIGTDVNESVSLIENAFDGFHQYHAAWLVGDGSQARAGHRRGRRHAVGRRVAAHAAGQPRRLHLVLPSPGPIGPRR